MHSPFIFEFITKVMNDTSTNAVYERVENLRQQLVRSETLIHVDDLGAGSAVAKTSLRSIGSIARNSAKPKKFGQLFYRMVKEYKPQTVLELGTSLGITTSYLASGNPSAKIITMEGAKSVARVAKENFKSLGLSNISVSEGNFDDVLPYVLSTLPSVDLCFIDGNHRKVPTRRYFKQLLPKVHNNSILIFDDIHWSQQMEEAWEMIKAHPSVRCTVDLFFIGIVFFRQEFKEKQDFVIRF
jgi:predicted O-methyltransferase YrrM